MKKSTPAWISAEVQERIKSSPILIIKKETGDVSNCDIIKIKMHRNLSDADSEMYELKIATFEIGQPEEFLALIKNFKTAIDGTGTMLAAVRMNYLLNLLRGEELLYFDKLASQNTGTNNAHLKFIQEGLLGFFINALSKQKRVMRRAMRKPHEILFKCFADRLT